MSYNALDAVKAAAATSADMNVAQSGGGGEYSPPAEGACGLRFVAYIELGKQEGTYKGAPKISDKAILTFEVHGAKWEVKEFDGVKVPVRISIELNRSLNEKAGFYKLFKEMNYEGKAKIMAELLGQDFSGRIYHRKFKRADGSEGVKAELVNPNTKAFTVTSPFLEDEDGNSKRRNVPQPLTEIKAFLWEYATKAMWDSIYIDGKYDDRKDKEGNVTQVGRSKNVFQERIKKAKNFVGSPIHTALETGGALEDTPVTQETKTPEQVKAERAATNAAKKKSQEAAQAAQEAAEAAAASQEDAGTDESDEDDTDPLNAF
jgi:hypothetical protein